MLQVCFPVFALLQGVASAVTPLRTVAMLPGLGVTTKFVVVDGGRGGGCWCPLPFHYVCQRHFSCQEIKGDVGGVGKECHAVSVLLSQPHAAWLDLQRT